MKYFENKKCPNCGEDMVDILYGMPMGEAFEKAERKELFLGGCCMPIEGEPPKYHCYRCRRSYYSNLKDYIEVK